LHYGYNNGDNSWWDWGFDTTDWTVDERRSSFHDRYGSQDMSYGSDSWSASKTKYDSMGMQRSPDADSAVFYTLGSGGAIDSRLEGMEQMDWRDGSLSANPGVPGANTIGGRMQWTNSGANPSWSISSWFPVTPPWVQNPNRPGDPIDPETPPSPWGPGGVDPGFHPWWVPDWPRKGPEKRPGDSPGPGQMMNVGYDNPSYGLGDVPGGSFMGATAGFATCLIPPPLQPAIPPGGLFGPDMPILPIWRDPGYFRPPDITSPHGDFVPWTHHGPLPGVRPGWWPLGTMGAGKTKYDRMGMQRAPDADSTPASSTSLQIGRIASTFAA
jgi:hypothetical protein